MLSAVQHECGVVLGEGGKCELTNVQIPSTAYVNIPSHAIVEGIVNGQMNYPAVGIAYVDGPSPTIKMGNYTISKGQAVVTYYEGVAPDGTRLKVETDIIYPMEGDYKLWACAGWIDVQENMFRVENYQEAHVYVSGAPACENYQTQAECEAAGCYWYNNSCHATPPTCSELTNQYDCERYGCYWYDDACHETPPPQPSVDWEKYLPYFILGGMFIVGLAVVKGK